MVRWGELRGGDYVIKTLLTTSQPHPGPSEEQNYPGCDRLSCVRAGAAVLSTLVNTDIFVNMASTTLFTRHLVDQNQHPRYTHL